MDKLIMIIYESISQSAVPYKVYFISCVVNNLTILERRNILSKYMKRKSTTPSLGQNLNLNANVLV